MQDILKQSPSETPIAAPVCLHCQEPVDSPNSKFCCNGCETVYTLLNKSGLKDYYTLRDQFGTLRKPQPARLQQTSYAYLDDPEQVQPLQVQDQRCLDFYLEGVHCAACVWLVEKLPELVPGVASSRLNLGNSTANVALTPSGNFEAVAQTLAQWGYRPHVVQKSSETEKLARQDQVMMLTRIGVAAFAAGNLMILAVALYAGIQGPLAIYFEWLSLLLAAPAVTFSAWPFYRQAFGQVVYSRQISIDVPIALSLVLGTLGGIWELIWGTHQIYFDSLAMLVFLLLASRYTLLRTQQAVLKEDRLLSFYTPQLVEKEVKGEFVPVALNSLAVGDVLRIQAGSRIPADGTLMTGDSQVDQSVLTGEAFPQPLHPGQTVFCGTRNLENPVTMRVTALGSECRLGQILTKSQANLEAKTHLVRLADRLARRFVSVVLTLAALLFLFYLRDPQVAIVRVLALAIISCPCALALATPLMVQISLKRALERGFFVRKAESLERLPDAKNLVFDKTGTLTQGRFELLEATGLEDPATRRAVLALESRSSHPVALALVMHLLQQGTQVLDKPSDFETLPGGGVSGTLQGSLWQIRPDASFDPVQSAGNAMVRLLVSENGQPRASLVLGDRLRPEVPEILNRLQQQGYTLWLLSGDQPAACESIGRQAGIPAAQVLSRQTPEAKEAFFHAHPDAVMVGDGINDILAMSKAKVGISVQGSAEENLQSADIYLAEQGIGQLPGLMRHARLTRRLLKLAMGFSLCYNLLGISAAVMGFVTPLAAAVLMPLSALTVLSMAILGGQMLCKS